MEAVWSLAVSSKESSMLTFILLAAGVILAIAIGFVAYGANQRKRSGQSGQSEVNIQKTGEGRPSIGRPTGMN